MNASVNELLSNPAFRPLVLLDVLAVFLMIICLVFRQFPGVLPLFGGQRGIVPGVFLFFFIHKPIL